MNEIVKYDNYMNGLKFTGFTAVDFNFLMLLCSKMRDKGTLKIAIPFNEIQEKTGYTRTALKKFTSDLERMNEKLMRITCKLRVDSEIIMFVLFPTFRIDLDKQLLTVSVNEEFKFILNELIKNFTRFDLAEFIQLNSKYSKSLYRLLKQYRISGQYEVSLENFRDKMDCPKAYNNKQFMQNVINPALNELKTHGFFKDLECTVQYAHRKGCPVTGYVFTFKPEERISGQRNQEPEPRENNRKSMNRFNNISGKKRNYDELESRLIANKKSNCQTN